MTTASAPGKIILLGEHAVVYDKLGVASTIDKRVLVTVSSGSKGIIVNSKGFGSKKISSEEELFAFLNKVNTFKEKKDFDSIKEISKREKLSPIFIVIANIMQEYGFQNIDVSIESDIPKNLGSSSAVCSATALAILKFLNSDPMLEEVSNLTYEGDVIAHGGTPSGIDNNTVTYGGYVWYKKSEGFHFLDVDFEIPLIIVNSGEPSRTSKTVPAIRKLREKKPRFVNPILDQLDGISRSGLDVLKSRDLEKFGMLMTEYYNELKRLRISTAKLDKIVSIALKNKALGTKPTGGWGGGCCIVLARRESEVRKLIEIYDNNGFNAFQTKLGVGGVRIEEE